MSELLIELLSEEIPAMMQQKAASAYEGIFAKHLKDHSISCGEIKAYSGPRRIAVHIKDMQTVIDPIKEEVKGPKVGAPDAALAGFCKSNNISKEQLVVKEIKGNDFNFYEREVLERKVKDILSEIIPRAISEYVWPKSMHWSNNKIKWVRPLKNILCLFDSEIIEFEYGHLKSNDVTSGHRFMSNNSFKVSSFEEYSKILADNYVILDAKDRKDIIESQLSTCAKDLGLSLKEDAYLLEEVNGLVEYPKILIGKIDAEFVKMPSEILVSAMREHQKYFSLFDKEGSFAPYFAFATNIVAKNESVVISGNEKVLSARLRDALHFYNQDLKTTLDEKSKKLEKVIFHAKLGTLKEKTERLKSIINFINPKDEDAKQAALICKGDIVSEVVDEFSDLQGIMGCYYAKSQGLNDNIATAIKDHYKPQGPSDACPRGSAALLALTDKIDSLCGLMIADEKPTGSKDPFALRRQTLGIIRIILENNLSVSLKGLVKFVVGNYSIKAPSGIEDEILLFISDRIKYFFKGKFEHNIILAILDLDKEDDLLEIKSKLLALKDFLSNDNGPDLVNVYKRSSNMIGKFSDEVAIDESLFINDYEKNLYSKLVTSKVDITDNIASNNYSDSLRLLAAMKPELTEFFNNVMVKDENQKIYHNRIALLQEIKGIFKSIADFDQI